MPRRCEKRVSQHPKAHHHTPNLGRSAVELRLIVVLITGTVASTPSSELSKASRPYSGANPTQAYRTSVVPVRSTPSEVTSLDVNDHTSTYPISGDV